MLPDSQKDSINDPFDHSFFWWMKDAQRPMHYTEHVKILLASEVSSFSGLEPLQALVVSSTHPKCTPAFGHWYYLLIEHLGLTPLP